MKSWNVKQCKTRQLKPNAGAMAVEFALIAPIFFLLIFATLELGIYLHDRQVLSNAAREAARFGIVMQNPRPGMTAIQQTALNLSITVLGTNLNCTPGGDCPDITVLMPQGILPGRPLTVTIATQFPFPFLSVFSNFAPNIPIGSTSTMIFE